MTARQADISIHSEDDGRNEMPSELEAVGRYMARFHIRNVPRNYQLVHEALYGGDRRITAALAALGNAPRQAKLDEIGLGFRLVSHCTLVANKSPRAATEMLREIGEQLAEGLRQKRRIAANADATPRASELDRLNASLSNLMLYETELTERLRGRIEGQTNGRR
jgi:hypothetical protein